MSEPFTYNGVWIDYECHCHHHPTISLEPADPAILDREISINVPIFCRHHLGKRSNRLVIGTVEFPVEDCPCCMKGERIPVHGESYQARICVVEFLRCLGLTKTLRTDDQIS